MHEQAHGRHSENRMRPSRRALASARLVNSSPSLRPGCSSEPATWPIPRWRRSVVRFACALGGNCAYGWYSSRYPHRAGVRTFPTARCAHIDRPKLQVMRACCLPQVTRASCARCRRRARRVFTAAKAAAPCRTTPCPRVVVKVASVHGYEEEAMAPVLSTAMALHGRTFGARKVMRLMLPCCLAAGVAGSLVWASVRCLLSVGVCGGLGRRRASAAREQAAASISNARAGLRVSAVTAACVCCDNVMGLSVERIILLLVCSEHMFRFNRPRRRGEPLADR